MKKQHVVLGAVVAAAGMSVAVAQGMQQGTPRGTPQRETMQPRQGAAQSDVDRRFIEDAIRNNLCEIESAQHVVGETSNPEVRRFAERMVQDHERANEQLKQAAEQLGVDVPDDMADWQQAKVDHLKELSGEELDRKYMIHQVGAHHVALLEHTWAQNNSQQQQIRQLTQQMVPSLRQHLQQAEQLATQLASGRQGQEGRPGQQEPARRPVRPGGQ